ncbi:MAG: hypothetical protein JW714_05715 [Candidatus Omnitrophica bacterium]|nr:hypothetical protein [Candidatus Omnitrophota bacterium]
MSKRGKLILLGLFIFVFACVFSTNVYFSWADDESMSVPEDQDEEITEEVEAQVLTVAPKTQDKRWDMSFGVETGYDDNVFKYANDDQNEFDAGTNPDKFANVDSIDDMITRLFLKLSLKNNFNEDTKTTLSLKARGNIYGRNSVKNYESYQAEVAHEFNKNFLSLTYLNVPDFFLRNLYDRDITSGNRYRKTKFERDKISLKYRRKVNNDLMWWIIYGYEEYDYNGDFKEYNNHANEVNLSLLYRLNPKLRAKLYYIFKRCEANAYDDEPNADFDISHRQHSPGIQFIFQPVDKWQFLLRYAYTLRDYTTDNSETIDPFHSGRENKIHNIRLKATRKFQNNWELFCQYEYETKDAKLTVDDATMADATLLGYNKNEVTIGTEYSF